MSSDLARVGGQVRRLSLAKGEGVGNALAVDVK
jgi:hypothetical protein